MTESISIILDLRRNSSKNRYDTVKNLENIYTEKTLQLSAKLHKLILLTTKAESEADPVNIGGPKVLFWDTSKIATFSYDSLPSDVTFFIHLYKIYISEAKIP